ncbi:MAG: hypothetical protein KDA21_03440 [Phycisphaerales bacterium]|nr:hypothetical protein [Phycisphaerales bacterium]
MPLTINVGLSRKRSENYQSEGVSINVTAELDQALLTQPRRLQEEIGALYRQAEQALDQRTGRETVRDMDRPPRHHNRVSAARENGNGSTHRPATTSQIRALRAITKRIQLDLEQECRDEFGCGPDQLDIQQASQLIDMLKVQRGGPRHE